MMSAFGVIRTAKMSTRTAALTSGMVARRERRRSMVYDVKAAKKATSPSHAVVTI